MTRISSRRATLAIAAAIATVIAGTQAQAQPATPAHVITYLEVAPAQVDAALALLRAHAAATRADAANIRIDLLRRIDRPHQFAMVERWRAEPAADAHRASAGVVAFRAALTPMLIAPYDERPHTTLSIGEIATAPGAITTVTHVDIIPPMREVGTENIRQLGEASRGTPGNLRFDVLIQNSRPNHFTLVESWRDEASMLAHAAAAPTRAYRNGLLPMSGSLFDERLYRPVD
jgi:quinol monooxygenase YgiN